jgi:hypothetical protein
MFGDLLSTGGIDFYYNQTFSGGQATRHSRGGPSLPQRILGSRAIAKKLNHREDKIPGRDNFDYALVVAQKEPGALWNAAIPCAARRQNP